MITLGINAAFHDSAACLVRDGDVVAAAEEERFTRLKHGKRPLPFSTWELPFHAIDYCLRAAGIGIAEVDRVAYSFDPYSLLGSRKADAKIELPLEPSAHPVPEEWLAAWDPLFLSSIVNAPRHLKGGAPHHLRERFELRDAAAALEWTFVPHHLSHAASAFLPSPFVHAAVMTLDGRGERATTSYGVGAGTRIDLLAHVSLPHSLGLLYEEVTSYLGFLRSSDEYKVMALASYGGTDLVREFRNLVQTKEGGRYEVAPLDLERRFGPPRKRGAPLERRHFDVARALQEVLEERVLELASWLHRNAASENLCLAGGVALNCVLNARIRDHGPFRRVWVQPAAGDAGTALGAALWVDAQERGEASYVMEHAYLGPEYGEDEIESALRWAKVPHRRLRDVPAQTAELLLDDKIVGWFQGRMEFGPRALGARSILASPLHAEMQARLNEIKDREDFRPVAPVVIEERAGEWFRGASTSPFMLFVYDVLPESAKRIPAVTHVDGTARIQTVRREQNPLYYDLLRAFEARTGVPVLVNTSFNTRGMPIVCSPRDALESFWTTPLDALVIGPFLVEKGAGAM